MRLLKEYQHGLFSVSLFAHDNLSRSTTYYVYLDFYLLDGSIYEHSEKECVTLKQALFFYYHYIDNCMSLY